MNDVPPTRMELLRVKQRVKLAKKGHGLLKRKRDAMIREFFILIRAYRELRAAVADKLGEAYDVLHVAQGVSGSNRVKGLAFSAEPSFTIEFSERSLMGVRVPQILVERLEGGMNASLIGTSYYVKDAADRFRDIVPDLVKLAETEQVLLRLADEIRSVKRRVNALEHIQIPHLEGTQKRIRDALAENEREEFVRLKHVKKQMESKG